MIKKKLYNNYEDIENDVDNGITVIFNGTKSFVKKIKGDYYLVAKTPKNKNIIYHPIRMYLLSNFKSYYDTQAKEDLIISQQAKFFASEIAGKISDKEELEEYLKIRLKEFLRIIND